MGLDNAGGHDEPINKNAEPSLSRRALLRGLGATASAAVATMFVSPKIGRLAQPDASAAPPASTPKAADNSTPKPIDKATQTATPHTLTDTKTTTPSSSVTEPANEAHRSFGFAETIDGIETYGHEESLTEEQLEELILKCNESPKEMAEDTMYGNIAISEETYRQFIEDNDKSFQTFLNRHEQFLNSLLQKAENPMKANIRRVFIVKTGPTQEGLIESLNRMGDSDGSWAFTGKYAPQEYGDFDPDNQVDKSLLHEWGHAFLHLPDGYSLDVSKGTLLPESLKNVPDQWKYYMASYRKDISDDLMTGGAESIGRYINLQLARRAKKGGAHNRERYWGEGAWSFPNELPTICHLDLSEEFKDATIEIYRSSELDPQNRPSYYDRKKKFDLLSTKKADDNGSVSLVSREIFSENPDQLIPAENGDILLRVITQDGKEAFRHMDVRDFNIAYWLGFENDVRMKFKLATANDTPENFPWTVRYSSIPFRD